MHDAPASPTSLMLAVFPGVVKQASNLLPSNDKEVVGTQSREGASLLSYQFCDAR